MRINTSLAIRQPLVMEESVDFSTADYSASYSLKNIRDLRVKATTTLVDTLFKIEISLSCILSLECGYSLEIFEQDLAIEDIFYFSNNQEDEDEDVYYEKGTFIDLDPYLFGLILAHIPLRVIKPGAKRPVSGDNFVVQTEEEYYQEREGMNNPFAELDLEDFID